MNCGPRRNPFAGGNRHCGTNLFFVEHSNMPEIALANPNHKLADVPLQREKPHAMDARSYLQNNLYQWKFRRSERIKEVILLPDI
jgi:hypothetical protein